MSLLFVVGFFPLFLGGVCNEWSVEGRLRKSACSCSLLALVSKHWALTPEVKMETHEVHWSWFLFPDLHNFIPNNIWCLWRYNTSAKLSRNFFSKQNSLGIYLRLDPKSPEMVKSPVSGLSLLWLFCALCSCSWFLHLLKEINNPQCVFSGQISSGCKTTEATNSLDWHGEAWQSLACTPTGTTMPPWVLISNIKVSWVARGAWLSLALPWMGCL